MDISKEIIVERTAEYGLILEKAYTIDIVYDYLMTLPQVTSLEKILNPIWGENILYFNYRGIGIVAVSAKGAPIAVNAVERIKRTGGKAIILIGTCGSTDESIQEGTFILPYGAVRDEGVSLGYLDKSVPALADFALTSSLYSKVNREGIVARLGVAFTTDKRYREDSDELVELHKHVGVDYVDMETSAFLLVARYYEIPAAAVKIVTDCAVKPVQGELKGIFDRTKDFMHFTKPKICLAVNAALEVLSRLGK